MGREPKCDPVVIIWCCYKSQYIVRRQTGPDLTKGSEGEAEQPWEILPGYEGDQSQLVEVVLDGSVEYPCVLEEEKIFIMIIIISIFIIFHILFIIYH